MRSLIENKKGQAVSIIVFFVLMIGILIASIVMLKLMNSILTPFASQLGNVSVAGGAAVSSIHTVATNWWDVFIILLMGINIVLLMVSAFMVDIHPAFAIVYIIAVFFMFIMGNYALAALDGVWNGMASATELAQTPMQQFIINNFNFLMLGIVLLSGIIMYAKFKFFQGQGSGGSA